MVKVVVVEGVHEVSKEVEGAEVEVDVDGRVEFKPLSIFSPL